MPGLTTYLINKLKETLLDCGPFESDRKLASVFVDERIAPWKKQISQAYNSKDRVNYFVSDFLNRKNRDGHSVIVLFLQVLHDEALVEDECHQRLDDVAIELAAALGTQLPPLAHNNLWRTEALRSGRDLPTNMAGYDIPHAESDANGLYVPLPTGLPASIFAENLETLKNKKADWLPVSFLEEGLKAARSVGRVEHLGRKIGTAFLVAPDLILTNSHVIKEVSILKQGGVRFDVESRSESHWCYFVEQIAHSLVEDLDFALIRLKTPAPGAPLSLSKETAYAQQPANILQFPGSAGSMMQVALRHNSIVHVGAKHLYYVTDTDKGSSGSPVFNDDWHVIALHRAGIVDDSKRPVKNANQGIPIMVIEPFIHPYLNGGLT